MKQVSFNLKNLLLAVVCLMSTLTASGGTTGSASFTMTSSVTTTPGAVVEIPIKMTSDKAIEKELVLNFTLSANVVSIMGNPLNHDPNQVTTYTIFNTQKWHPTISMHYESNGIIYGAKTETIGNIRLVLPETEHAVYTLTLESISCSNIGTVTGAGKTCVITVGSTSLAVGDTFYGDGVYYKITSSNYVSVTQPIEKNDYRNEMIIPSRVTYGNNIYIVNHIEDNAFLSCYDLISIDLPNTLQSIGNSAFYYTTGLTDIFIPESVTTIGQWNFYCNDALKTVSLPSGLTSMGTFCFSSCGALESVTCKATTPPTATNCFTRLPSGAKLYVPAGSESQYQAVEGWSNFQTANAAAPYDFAVGGIYYRITGTSPATVGVTYKDTNYNSYSSSSVTIPETVTRGGKEYSVTSIGMRAFQNCSELTSVTLPPTIKTINNLAFYNCQKLKSINLPRGLTRIGTYAFYYCTKLSSVTIPSTVTVMDTYAFCGCQSFTEVIIPNSVTNIGYGAFYDCTQLATVTLGSGVRWMGSNVFYGCAALTSVTCLAATPPTLQSDTFNQSHYSSVIMYVAKGALSAYQSATYWSNFSRKYEVNYDFMVDGIYYNILKDGVLKGEAEVTYRDTRFNTYSGRLVVPGIINYNNKPWTVTAIGNYAFRDCDDLTSLTLPTTITEIKPYAFYGCSGLSSLDIPNSVTTISYGAFSFCDKLTHVTIPSSVTSIGYEAFSDCSALTSVVIGKNVTRIGDECFIYDPLLTEITCLAETPPVANGTSEFFGKYEDVTLRVPYGSHEAYRNTAPWSQLSHIVSNRIAEPVIAGDVNDDGLVNISDVTTLINLLLEGTNHMSDHPAADVNGDGLINISDVTTLINRLLNGSTAGLGIGATLRSEYLINSVPFTMVKVDGGTFMMGLENESLASPVHQVTLPDYYIGQTEVTQALWQTVMGSNPSYFTSDVNLPVENMTWNECQTFVKKIGQMTGQNFRLPTEAEWEFAARGGNKSQGYTYAGSNTLGDVAWYQDNSSGKTHVVATKPANELSLHDMSGNVFEWCQDHWGSYTAESQIDPQGPLTGDYYVCRSAAYNRPSVVSWFMCGGRTYDQPTTKAQDTGLRLSSRADGEWAYNGDGTPSTVGQAVNDHLFVRDTSGADNQIRFIGTSRETMWIWLDDDEIYQNAAVQALTPIEYTSGKRYNEITYNNFQFELYLPANLTLVDADGTPLSGPNEALLGDRCPEFSTVQVGKQGVKTINGAEYNVYLVIGYNFSGYHLSGSTYNYQHYGAMHKDDAPLLGFYIKNTDMSAKNGPVADIYIANTEFGIRECITANWDANDRRFFYCTGGNNESQRYQRYVPVKVRYQ